MSKVLVALMPGFRICLGGETKRATRFQEGCSSCCSYYSFCCSENGITRDTATKYSQCLAAILPNERIEIFEFHKLLSRSRTRNLTVKIACCILQITRECSETHTQRGDYASVERKLSLISSSQVKSFRHLARKGDSCNTEFLDNGHFV